VILDEIGRGTSTYDGVSLAWAIVEHIHDAIGCRTLFATHYHELTDLSTTLGSVRNLNVAVKEWEDHVVFLQRSCPSGRQELRDPCRSLAGVPLRSTSGPNKSWRISNRSTSTKRDVPNAQQEEGSPRDLQLTLFAPYDHPLLDEIRAAKLNSLTPLEALQLIQRWQQVLAE